MWFKTLKLTKSRFFSANRSFHSLGPCFNVGLSVYFVWFVSVCPSLCLLFFIWWSLWEFSHQNESLWRVKMDSLEAFWLVHKKISWFVTSFWLESFRLFCFFFLLWFLSLCFISSLFHLDPHRWWRVMDTDAHRPNTQELCYWIFFVCVCVSFLLLWARK